MYAQVITPGFRIVFGASGSLDPVAAAWIPNGLFFATGVVLLSRVRT